MDLQRKTKLAMQVTNPAETVSASPSAHVWRVEQVARNFLDVLIAEIFFRLVLLQSQQAIQGNEKGS